MNLSERNIVFLKAVLSFHHSIVRISLISIYFKTKQDDFNCGVSSQADFVLNYFLSNFLIISAQTFLAMRTGKNAVKGIKKNQEKCG